MTFAKISGEDSTTTTGDAMPEGISQGAAKGTGGAIDKAAGVGQVAGNAVGEGGAQAMPALAGLPGVGIAGVAGTIGGAAGGIPGVGIAGVAGSVGGIAGGSIAGVAGTIGGSVGGIAGVAGSVGGIADVAGGISGVAGIAGAVGGLAGVAGGIAGVAGSIGGAASGIAGVASSIAGAAAGIAGVAGGIAGIAGSVGGAVGGIAGGAAAGLPGGIGGLPGGKITGIAGDVELPFFEEKAVTSTIKGGLTGALGNAGGLAGKAAGAIAAGLGGKNLEIEVGSGDALDVRNFSVHERISSLFQVNVIALCENPSIEFDAVVGLPARFAVHAGAHERFWSGICNHFEQVRVEPDGASTYQISIVPPLWLLTQRKNYRMFQQISEPDIVLKVLKEWDIIPEVRIDRGAYKKRKYRVQYAESDFDFINRMLEDAGIAYYFEQVGDESKLVLSDAPHTNPKRAGSPTFVDDTSMTRKTDNGTVSSVRMTQRVRPGKITLRDHDYRRHPSYKLMTSAAGGRGIEEKLERFHYTPGAFLFGSDQGEATPVADDRGKTRTDEKEGAILAQKRLDAKRGSARVCTFETTAHDLSPGMVMSMSGHPHEALGDSRALLIVESSLNGTDNGDWSHHCEARSTEVPFRPDLVTPKPTVNGVESATVVGPPGEEIHTDEFGRARVHFHWDRESKMDDGSSCWIQVSQPWGGSGYGGMNLPRVGQEVLVDFLGGDPDRPVIVGRMYTNLQKVPYKLPQDKTKSGWKSNSTGGGGGYNELMFEDAKGREMVNIQAEKDLTKLVKHDETVTIGRNRNKVVKHNDDLTVGKNRSKRIVKNESVTVGIKRTTTIGQIDGTTAGAKHSVTISPNSGGATSTTHTDGKIVFTTGKGATITMEGAEVKIEAAMIHIVSTSGTEVASRGGDVLITGGPFVKINP